MIELGERKTERKKKERKERKKKERKKKERKKKRETERALVIFMIFFIFRTLEINRL